MGHVQRSAVMTTRDDFPRGRQPSLDEGLPMDRTAYPPLAEMALAPDREQAVESADGRTSVMSARDYAGELERVLDAHPPSDGSRAGYVLELTAALQQEDPDLLRGFMLLPADISAVLTERVQGR
jgi:hypothetical protein